MDASPQSTHLFRKIVALIVLISVGGGVMAWYHLRPQTGDTTEVDLPDGVDPADFETAEKEFQNTYGHIPDRIDVFSWLAEKSYNEKKFKQAAACFQQIPPSHPKYGRSARHQLGSLLIDLKQAAAAERELREFLELESRDPKAPVVEVDDARERLRFLLEVQLRFEERSRLLAEMVPAGRGDTFDVMFYCFPSLLRWNGPEAVTWLEEFFAKDPTNLNLRIALGRYRTGQGRLDEARDILKKCRQDAPNNLHAIAADFARLRELGDWESINKELAQLPPVSSDEPWLLLRIRGHVHNRKQEFQKAVDCFGMALEKDPANAESCLGLVTAYGGLKQRDEQRQMAEKAKVLSRIQNRLGWGQSDITDVKPFLEIAKLCEQIQLEHRAFLIASLASRYAPENAEVRQILSRLKAPKKSGRQPGL